MAGSTTLRFPDTLKAEASVYADALGVSLNALCAVALRDYLDARKGQAAATTPQGVAELATPPPAIPKTPAASVRSSLGVPAARPKGRVIPVGVNEPCPCGSGKKYKRCHGKPGA
jgi:predicted transcriptional regulator